eukprot:964107_1
MHYAQVHYHYFLDLEPAAMLLDTITNFNSKWTNYRTSLNDDYRRVTLRRASDDIIFQDAGGNDFASIKASKFQTIFYGEQLTYLQSGLEWVGMDFLSGFIKKK